LKVTDLVARTPHEELVTAIGTTLAILSQRDATGSVARRPSSVSTLRWHHTAALVSGATLRIVDRLGHLSIALEIVSAVRQVLACANAGSSVTAS
jgi:hypothetical protein